jgi:hypothetical protein
LHPPASAKQEKQDWRSAEILRLQLPDRLHRMSGLLEGSASLDTHWSRILFHDLFGERGGSVARDPDASTDEDPGSPASDAGIRRGRGQFGAMAMTTDVYRDDADFSPGRSPIAAAVVLLGVFVAAYLAVAGLIRVLSSPDTTSVVMRQTGVNKGNRSAGPERTVSVLRSRGNSHA